MKYSAMMLVVFLLIQSVQAQNSESQTIEVVDYEQLMYIQNSRSLDKLILMNFWATWCKPCVEEMPELMNIYNEFKHNPKVEVWLISLDHVRVLEKKVQPFIQENNIHGRLFLLDDIRRQNEWIPAFEKAWTGSIPATIVFKDNQKIYFIEDVINEKDIVELIKKNL